MKPLDAATITLATWRISSLFVEERGPFDIFTRVREAFGFEHDEDGKVIVAPDNHLLGCVWCFSVWVGAVLCILPAPLSRPFAASAMTIFLHKFFGPKE